MRTIIIGDIHGCSGALRALLEMIKPDEKVDRLILLGDLFDRGPDSWGVFQMVKELAVKFGDRFVLLRGNHDDYLLTRMPSMALLRMWERVGRGTCVHAGLRFEPIESNDPYTLIHDHGVAMSNRYAGPLTIVGHIALERPVWFPGEKKLVKEIPEGTWYELPPRGVICIDTGCGKGGRLTGMVVEDGKFVLESVGEWY